MQVEKKKNNNGYNTIHDVNESQRNNNYYVSTLSFFYLHLAKNFQFQIFLANYSRYRTKQNHPWDGKKLAAAA